jgi:hypothetical protein
LWLDDVEKSILEGFSCSDEEDTDEVLYPELNSNLEINIKQSSNPICSDIEMSESAYSYDENIVDICSLVSSNESDLDLLDDSDISIV